MSAESRGLITPGGRAALAPLASQGGRGLGRKRSRLLDLVRSGGIAELIHLSGRRHLIRFCKDKKKKKKGSRRVTCAALLPGDIGSVLERKGIMKP